MQKSNKNRPADRWIQKIRENMKENKVHYYGMAPKVMNDRKKANYQYHPYKNSIFKGPQLIKHRRLNWNPEPYKFPNDSLAQARLKGDVLGVLRKKTEKDIVQQQQQVVNVKKREQQGYVNLPADMYDTKELPNISLFQKPHGKLQNLRHQRRYNPYQRTNVSSVNNQTISDVDQTKDFLPPCASTPFSLLTPMYTPMPQPRLSPKQVYNPTPEFPLPKKTYNKCLSKQSQELNPDNKPKTLNFKGKQQQMMNICNLEARKVDQILFPNKPCILETTRVILRRVEDMFKVNLRMKWKAKSCKEQEQDIPTFFKQEDAEVSLLF